MVGLQIVLCNLGGNLVSNDIYLLSDTIVFDSKPIAVPYNYRISYKISQIMLIISLCCSRGGCSLVKLHMISMALSSKDSMEKLLDFANRGLTEIPVVRFDPTVNRALLFAISEKLIVQQKDGKLRLTVEGKNYISAIINDKTLMVREKNSLNQLSTKITEKVIGDIMTNWRYQNATN